jgi:hypothetical protein
MNGEEVLDHTRITELAAMSGIVDEDATDDIWGKIGISGNIISWKSIRGKTDESMHIPIASSLGLGVKIIKDA